MGAKPYWYVVKYQPDLHGALHELREREFRSGHYYPAQGWLTFPIDERTPSPGAEHESIEEALEAAAEEGTKSILDLDHISDEREFCAVTPLTEEQCREYFGTDRPTRAMVEAKMDFMDDIDRGHGVCITLYKEGRADEIMFAGYSVD